MSLALVNVRRSLNRLERFQKSAHSRFLDSVLRYNKNRAEVEERIGRATKSFAITPVRLDPSGIIGKLEHVIDTYDSHLKAEVRAVPSARARLKSTL